MKDFQEYEALEKQLRQIPADKASSALYDRLQKKATWNKPAWLPLIGATILFFLLLALLFLQPQDLPIKLKSSLQSPQPPAPIHIAARPTTQHTLRLSEVISPFSTSMWRRQTDFTQPFDSEDIQNEFKKSGDV